MFVCYINICLFAWEVVRVCFHFNFPLTSNDLNPWFNKTYQHHFHNMYCLLSWHEPWHYPHHPTLPLLPQVTGGNKWANAGKMKCNHTCRYTSSLPNIRKILQDPTLYRHSRHIKSSTSCYATEQQPILIKTISELTLTRRQQFRFSPFSLQVPTHFLYQNLWCAG